MPETILVPLVLVLLAALFLLSPVMMNRSVQRSGRRSANIDLFKSRLAELESERDSGALDAVEFESLKMELERRLLEEAEAGEQAESGSIKVSLKTALVLTLVIPIVAVIVYQQTGAKADWDIAQTLKTIDRQSGDEAQAKADVTRLIQRVDKRLQQQPENADYLMLLASQHMELGNYPAATDAYQRLAVLFPEDANVLARYAQSLYLSSGRALTAKVKEISGLALLKNPQQPTVLSMLGIAHFEQGDYQAAIDYWQRLLPALGPVSPNRKMIMAGIDQAKARLGISSDTEVEKPATVAASIQVAVSMAEGVAASSDKVVFVFARAASGPRMPLAVARLRVSDLPTTVTLDDSMAMAPGMTLSSQPEIEVVARIAKNGIANPGPGDIEGRVGPINLSKVDGAVSISINTIL